MVKEYGMVNKDNFIKVNLSKVNLMDMEFKLGSIKIDIKDNF